MSQNPLNLTLRFILEMVALVMIGVGAARFADGIVGVLLGVIAVLLAAALWGSFRTRGDHHSAPIPVPGIVRLLIEGVFFGAAVLLNIGSPWATGLALVVILHYALSYDRVWRLLWAF